jgi:hypothetical protein
MIGWGLGLEKPPAWSNVININDKKSLPSSSQFHCDREAEPETKSPAESSSSLPQGMSEKDPAFKSFRDAPNKLGLLLFNLTEAKGILRNQVEDQLESSLSIPELVDQVVEYLAEVIQEDPRRRKLFGLP